MLHLLRKVIEEHRRDEDLDFMQACHRALTELYPGLNLRWVRIYGKRLYLWQLGGPKPRFLKNTVKSKLRYLYR